MLLLLCFFFSSRRRHTRSLRDWSSDVCSSDLAQLAKVVNLAVAYKPQRSVAIRQRLVPAGQIDDRKAPHADGAGAVGMVAFVIGSSVHDDTAHDGHERRVSGLAVELEDAVDAAHVRAPWLFRS